MYIESIKQLQRELKKLRIIESKEEIEGISARITALLQLLPHMYELYPLEVKKVKEIPNETQETPVTQGTTYELEVDKDIENPIGKLFTFRLNASGGTIPALNYPLPESFVSHNDLKNGAIIRVNAISGYFEDGKPKYDVAIHSNEEQPHDLISLDYVIVSESMGSYYVDTNSDGSLLKIDNDIVTYKIQQRDVDKYRLKDGDIVCGRVYKNNDATFRITKYIEAEEIPEQEVKKNIIKINTKKVKKDYSKLFQLTSCNILLVGLDKRVSDFKQELEAATRNLQVECNIVHLPAASITEKRVLPHILNADVVFGATFQASHSATDVTKKLCKKNNIDFRYTNARSFDAFIDDCIEYEENVMYG